jgi:predicted O-methyltransferase YrrM
MHLIREYINYIRKAQGRHQIHSPFVYDFVDKCLRISFSNDLKEKYKSLTRRLSNNETRINTTDLGAGSKKMGTSRAVSSIYKNASCKGTYAKLLYQISKHYQPTNILELGTNLGVGTFFLNEGNPNAYITTIDGCLETQNVAKQHILNKNVHFVHASFDDYLDALTTQKFDLIYIDGDHRGVSLIRYLAKLDHYCHSETLIVLDDIRWSEDMLNTWKKLINSETYHLTLDLFKVGILIKKQGKEKEHFMLRIKNVLTSL